MTAPLDPVNLIPRNKFDLERVEALFALDVAVVEPVLYDVATWMADPNWPIAYRVREYLETVGAPLIPIVLRILESSETDWKCGILYVLERMDPVVTPALREALERLSLAPDDYNNDATAIELLARMPGADPDALRARAEAALADAHRDMEARAPDVALLGLREDDDAIAWDMMMNGPAEELAALRERVTRNSVVMRDHLLAHLEEVRAILADPERLAVYHGLPGLHDQMDDDERRAFVEEEIEAMALMADQLLLPVVLPAASPTDAHPLWRRCVESGNAYDHERFRRMALRAELDNSRRRVAELEKTLARLQGR